MWSASEQTRLERLINRLIQPLPAPLATVVAFPLGVAGVLAIFGAWALPRRLPDLSRFIVSDEFVAVRSTAAEPQPPPKANRFQRPVQTVYANVDELAARALADHEHVIAIALQHCYYLNPDIRRYPVPRRLVPLPLWLPFRRQRD
jgi:hypothetical protein